MINEDSIQLEALLKNTMNIQSKKIVFADDSGKLLQ